MKRAGPRRIKWDKAKIIESLQRRRDRSLPLNISEILKADTPLGGAIARHFGSHDKALLAAGINPADARMQMCWDRAKVITGLKKRNAAGLGVRRSQIERSDGRLAHAIRSYFDSHEQALHSAGIKPPPVFRWDKAAVVKALQKRRDDGLALNPSAIKQSNGGLSNAIKRCYGSHDKAIVAAGLDPAAIRGLYYWSQAKVIAALRDLHAKGVALNAAAIHKQDRRLEYAIYSQFPSHEAALRAAGIEPPAKAPPPWNKDRIIAELKGRRKRGESLSGIAIRRSDPSLAYAILRDFGSVTKALAAAAIKMPAVPQPVMWSKKSITAALKRRQKKGMDLNHYAVRNTDRLLGSAITRHFGSHDAALRAAGIDPTKARHAVAWDKDKIIAAVQRRQRLGLPIFRAAIQKTDCGLAGAMVRYFGSHDAALTAAGIEPAAVRQTIQWDRDKVIKALLERKDRGLSVSDGDIRKSDQPLRGAIKRHFKTPEAALIAAGLDPAEARRRSASGGNRAILHWTGPLVLQTLAELNRDGHDLRYSPMKKRSQPLFFAAKQFFGSYVNAVREAGIDYWKMSQVQLARERAGRKIE